MPRVTCLRSLSFVSSVALALAACGERVDAARVQAWSAAGDHDHLRDATRDAKLAPEVRADAAAALVAAGQPALLQWAIASLTLEDRNALVPLVGARVAPTLAPAPGAADPKARAAREALFLLRQQATTPAARAAVEAILFPALEATLKQACATGWQSGKAGGEVILAMLSTDCPGGTRFGVGAMLVDVGDPSLPIVQHVLEDPAAPFAVAVEVLAKIGDADAKAKGGGALAKRAAAMPAVPDELWDALATLGGEPARAFVIEKIKAGGPVGERAAAASLKFRRDPEFLPTALALAGDRAVAPKIRADMMQLARKVAGPDARKGLVELIAKEPDAAMRWQLVDAALPLSGNEALFELLEALPPGATRAELQEHVIAPLGKMGWEPRAGLFKAMETATAKPLSKLVAIWTLEASNWKSDGEHVAKLGKDPGGARGIPGVTVGREAARVADKLKRSGM